MSARSISLVRILVLVMLCGLLSGGAVLAQDDWPATVMTLENPYIGVAIGMYGKWRIPPHPHSVIGDQPAGGRFQLWTTGGDPVTAQDDNLSLIYSSASSTGGCGDKWAAFQLMMDSNLTSGTTEGDATGERAWAIFDRGGTSAILGDVHDGYWAVYPYIPSNQPNVIRGVWYPIFEDGVGPTQGQGTVRAYPLRCEMEVRLMRDTVRFKWTIVNEDAMEHMVGLRCYADQVIGGIDDGTRGLRNVVSVSGRPLVVDQTVLFGKDIPAAVELLNSQESPVVSFRHTLRGQGATPPDVFGVDDWFSVISTNWTYWFGVPDAGADPYSVWGYEPVPYTYIDDLATGMSWKPKRILPNGKLTYITYMGLGSATSEFAKPSVDYPQYVAAAQSIRAMKYGTNETTGAGELYPNPFTIHAWLNNTEKSMDLQNASFTLTLPYGLELDASEGGKYSKAVASVPANSEAHVSWKVVPVGNPTGILDYTVSVSSAPVGGTTLRRQINIPATQTQAFSSGWQMISVPFALSNPDPISSLGLQNPVLWRYDTYARVYKPVTKFEPGEAYWLKLDNAQTAVLATGNCSPITWADNQGTQIPLKAGWNLIGNPYVYTVTLGEVKFYYRQYGTMTYEEALERGLISNTLFWWDPLFRQYKWSSDRTAQIKPWQGYWLRAMRDEVLMIITPSSQIGAAVGGQPTPEEMDGGSGDDPVGPPPAP